MSDHDDMTNADVMSADELAEDDRRVEYALDAADEERHQQIRDINADEPDDGDGCHAEFIDGSWTYCGCEECDERETRDGDEAFESGHASEEEPW